MLTEDAGCAVLADVAYPGLTRDIVHAWPSRSPKTSRSDPTTATPRRPFPPSLTALTTATHPSRNRPSSPASGPNPLWLWISYPQ